MSRSFGHGGISVLGCTAKEMPLSWLFLGDTHTKYCPALEDMKNAAVAAYQQKLQDLRVLRPQVERQTVFQGLADWQLAELLEEENIPW